jgi:GrpB-like predicted nucleotidyltransferase (UPF0157 family)
MTSTQQHPASASDQHEHPATSRGSPSPLAPVPQSLVPGPSSLLDQGMRSTVRVVPYDTTWPLEFEAEMARIERACDGLPIRLEHIGSTSIPGLAAKPVIDILAGRPGTVAGSAYVAAFKQLGYEHKGAYGIPGRNYFRKGTPRTHHVHLVSWSSDLWRDHLLFRDYLRTHPEIAREYETIKRELATMYLQDKEKYTDAKGPFVRSIVRRARDEGFEAFVP